jgi:3-hydroxyacyl-CoA dehydrogenase
VAQFARELVVSVGAYALNRVGEIAGTAQEIDLAMRAGFGRELGPIETLDAIGLERARAYMQEFRVPVPHALEDAIQSGHALVERPAAGPGVLRLQDLREPGGIVRENLSSRLWDLGDGVLCCELSAKMVPDMNPVDDYVISMMEQAFEEIESGRFRALVVSNQAKNFCAGANLMMVLELAKQKRFADIEAMTRRLQAVNLANLRAPFPVVTAPHGLTLGGGLEVAMGGQVRVCHAELYTGLVEVGVGLIPAGGGCFFLLRNLIDRGRKRNSGPMPPVMQALDLIGFGKVSSSAYDAKYKGLIRKDDVVVFSKDALLAEAKRVALSRLEDFAPIEVESLTLPGVGGRLVIEQNLDEMVCQGKLTEHSRTIARVQARILTGGDSASPANPVSVDTIFELEREGFLTLCGEPKTQERMGYMLKKGKPLIN